MSYLVNNEAFRGTGEANAAGETLEEFLEKYDPKKYDCPSNTVDMLIFCTDGEYREWGQPLKLLMVKRSNHPNIGQWALPGGFVNLRENLEDAAARELLEETGVSGAPLIQLRTWGDYDRDPRWRVITTAYMALLDQKPNIAAGDDAGDAAFMDLGFEETASNDGSYKCRLTLSEESRGLHLEAWVKVKGEKRGILENVSYELISSKGIAGDHGLIIADALLRIKESAAKSGLR